MIASNEMLLSEMILERDIYYRGHTKLYRLIIIYEKYLFFGYELGYLMIIYKTIYFGFYIKTSYCCSEKSLCPINHTRF